MNWLVERLMIGAVLLGLAPVHARQQPAIRTSGTSPDVTIIGRVLADDTGDPIPNARVALQVAGDASPIVTLADSSGRFAIVAAASGRYRVAASKAGYARREVPASGSAIEIRLKRSAAISGRVVDDFDDPVVNARVIAETVPSPPAASTVVAASRTDDFGEYRLAGLGAGSVTVALEMQRFADVWLAGTDPKKTYYPGAPIAAAAERLNLESGAEMAGIDFVIPARDPGPPSLVPGPGNQLVVPPRLTGGTGTVRGQVETTGGAVPHASVLLTANNVLQWQGTIADANGAFEIRDVPAGRFRLRAYKAGYSLVPRNPGDPQQLGSEALFELGEGETREGLRLGLARWRALAGRVFDERGDPLPGVSVSVMQVRYEAGRRRLVTAATAMQVSDDLGRYRLFDLPAGRYIVSGALGGVIADDVPGYARSYFPGTPSPNEAQFVSVGSTQDLTGLDFAMSRVQTARITGRAVNAAGERIAGSLTLFSSRSSAIGASYGARIMPDGAFEFRNVPPGQYVIQAYRGRVNESTEGEFGAMTVSVAGRDISGLTLQTGTGSRIAGRVVFDDPDASRIPVPSSVAISPIPADFDLTPTIPAVAEARSDGTFVLAGINGPRRLQLLRVPPGWMLKAILVNGIDVTDQPLPFGRSTQSLADVEVVLTDHVTEVKAVITDDHMAPVADARLLVFSTSRGDWYEGSRFVRQAPAAADGTATVTGLPAGTYHLLALASRAVGDGDDWQDPASLEAWAALASTVVVNEAQAQSVTLRVVDPRR